MSTHGDMHIPALGKGSPTFYRATKAEITSPPPAESPAIDIFSGEMNYDKLMTE